MKTRFLTLTALLLCTLLLLTGCGNTADSTESEAAADSEAVAETETEAAPEAAEDAADEEKTVSFGLNETVTEEGLCEMSGLYSEVLDDEAMAEGWYYYYTDSKDSPANIIHWEVSGENYTTAEVLFTVKNISDAPQTFGDKLTARMLWQENGDAEAVCYDGTVFQQNPGQVEASGEMVMWSTNPVEIAAGESANVSFRFDIPKGVYEKMYATAMGENPGITETCAFSFGGGTTYVVDLAETLIAASQYKS